jgi:GTP cyclohydrolase IA
MKPPLRAGHRKPTRPTPTRPAAVAAASRAIQDLLLALGCELKGELVGTPRRVALLWADHLLAGARLEPRTLLGRGSATRSRAPVTLQHLGVHLVCPHHLTVAFGTAHVAYLPNRRAAGFGALARLVRVCTARLVLQEEASQAVAETIVDSLGARAAAVVIDAVHPCHNVPHGRSHRAHAVTWGEAGDPRAARDLRQLLSVTLCEHRPTRR